MESEKLRILKEIFGSCHKVSEEWLFTCPRCEHHKRKLSINVEKNCFKCWICDYHGKSIFRLIRKYGQFSHKLKWENFESIVDLSSKRLEDVFLNIKENEEYVSIDLPSEFQSLCNKSRWKGINARNYLTSRSVNHEDILKWKVGYCDSGEYGNRVVVPSFDERGNVNFFVTRAYGNQYIKNKLANASKDVVFNELYVDWDSDVVLVEGIFDAFKAENSVPILGSTLREDSKLVNKIVKHDSTIYLALDADVKKKTARLMKSLLQYDIELYRVDVEDKKDVGDMTKEEFRELKDNASLVTFDNYLMYLM